MEAEASSHKRKVDEGIEPKSIYARRAFGASSESAWASAKRDEGRGIWLAEAGAWVGKGEVYGMALKRSP
jgi:hypothetical protein